jgi:hypothetical protein
MSDFALRRLDLASKVSAAVVIGRQIIPYLLVLIVCGCLSASPLAAQVAATPTPQFTPVVEVSPEMVRKAYMNCLLEVDKTGESLIGHGKAREAESKSQLRFCDNRKKDCGVNRNAPECRTFVEEFATE